MRPDFRHARFITSVAALDRLPPDSGREAAFAGRSNAGKSSALNAISGVSGLARVSKTPGRTRLINLFEVAPAMRFVDLPGYGYAKVPQAERARWVALLEGYLETRDSLAGLIVVMDVRHPLGEFDRQLLGYAGALQLPVHVLLSKADKLGRSATAKSLVETKRALRGWGSAQLFSAHTGEGVEEVRGLLLEWLRGTSLEAEKK